MDWMVYWFMFPVCIGVAGAAMFTGISGAAMLMPVFLLGFPLLGVAPLGAATAVGISLFLEAAGFGTGVYRYLRRGLVDTRTARRLAVVTLPAGIVGALAARWVAADVLRAGYGTAMVALAALLAVEPSEQSPPHDHPAATSPGAAGGGRGAVSVRTLTSAEGTTFRYTPAGIRGQQLLSGLGAILAGLISTGVGEATLPGLVRRSRFPVPVAAATSTVVVAATVTGASLTHLAELARTGGLVTIPWNLIVWAVPGAVLGAIAGTHLQGRIPQRAARRFFAGLFAAIGVVFILLVTL